MKTLLIYMLLVLGLVACGEPSGKRLPQENQENQEEILEELQYKIKVQGMVYITKSVNYYGEGDVVPVIFTSYGPVICNWCKPDEIRITGEILSIENTLLDWE